jgi:DNA-binding beta-propeller fold protein YncE
MKRLIVRGAAVAAIAGMSAGCAVRDDGTVPLYEVDALWPQPLEYPAILGPVSGVAVAPDGNVLIVTQSDRSFFSAANEINTLTGTGECCTPIPGVAEFAADGSLVRQWGGPDVQGWPSRPHGIAVDPEGNVWIGGGWYQPPNPAGRGGRGGRGGAAAGGRGAGAGAAPQEPPPPPPAPVYDTHILKFSRTGELIATIGTPGGQPNSASTNSFGGAADFSFDADASEVYVADGYANHRVAVLDMATGAVKRSWGAYGNAPEDAAQAPYDPSAPPAQQFGRVTCAELSNDGMVYVCDQTNNRIQVFETDGTFVEEVTIAPNTRLNGTVRDIAFSEDADQRWLFVTDGTNERVYVLFRGTLEVKTSFGVGGRYPSHFRELGGIAVAADGTVYTAEDGQGRRVQRFVRTGIGPVPAEHQGAVYPQSAGGM